MFEGTKGFQENNSKAFTDEVHRFGYILVQDPKKIHLRLAESLGYVKKQFVTAFGCNKSDEISKALELYHSTADLLDAALHSIIKKVVKSGDEPRIPNVAGFFEDCCGDIISYLDYQGIQEVIAPFEQPEKKRFNQFSELVYLRCSISNNIAVLLSLRGQSKQAAEELINGLELRKYDTTFNQEKLQLIVMHMNLACIDQSEEKLTHLISLCNVMKEIEEHEKQLLGYKAVENNPFLSHMLLRVQHSTPIGDYPLKFHPDLPFSQNYLRLLALGYENASILFRKELKPEEAQNCLEMQEYYVQKDQKLFSDDTGSIKHHNRHEAHRGSDLKKISLETATKSRESSRGCNLDGGFGMRPVSATSQVTNISQIQQQLHNVSSIGELEVTPDDLLLKNRSNEMLYKVSFYKSGMQRCILVMVYRKPDDYCKKKLIDFEEIGKKLQKPMEEVTDLEIEKILNECLLNIRIYSTDFTVRDWCTFGSLGELVLFRNAKGHLH